MAGLHVNSRNFLQSLYKCFHFRSTMSSIKMLNLKSKVNISTYWTYRDMLTIRGKGMCIPYMTDNGIKWG